jgi:hypothetical protein
LPEVRKSESNTQLSEKSIKHTIAWRQKTNLGRIGLLHTSMQELINRKFKGMATKCSDYLYNYVQALHQETDLFDVMTASTNKMTRREFANKIAF